MKKARLLITQKCNRNCPNCCNADKKLMASATYIYDINELAPYAEINITGGEPLLDIDRTIEIAKYFKKCGKTVYLYTALYNPKIQQLIPFIDGLHFTLHKDATEKDVLDFALLQSHLTWTKDKSFRLYIVKGMRPLIMISPSVWSRIEQKPWMDECPLPEGEELFILK